MRKLVILALLASMLGISAAQPVGVCVSPVGAHDGVQWDRWHIAAEKVTSTPLELKCKYAAELPDSAWAGACKVWFTDGNGTMWGLQVERLNDAGLLVCKYGGSR